MSSGAIYKRQVQVKTRTRNSTLKVLEAPARTMPSVSAASKSWTCAVLAGPAAFLAIMPQPTAARQHDAHTYHPRTTRPILCAPPQTNDRTKHGARMYTHTSGLSWSSSRGGRKKSLRATGASHMTSRNLPSPSKNSSQRRTTDRSAGYLPCRFVPRDVSRVAGGGRQKTLGLERRFGVCCLFWAKNTNVKYIGNGKCL